MSTSSSGETNLLTVVPPDNDTRLAVELTRDRSAFDPRWAMVEDMEIASSSMNDWADKVDVEAIGDSKLVLPSVFGNMYNMSPCLSPRDLMDEVFETGLLRAWSLYNENSWSNSKTPLMRLHSSGPEAVDDISTRFVPSEDRTRRVISFGAILVLDFTRISSVVYHKNELAVHTMKIKARQREPLNNNTAASGARIWNDFHVRSGDRTNDITIAIFDLWLEKYLFLNLGMFHDMQWNVLEELQWTVQLIKVEIQTLSLRNMN